MEREALSLRDDRGKGMRVSIACVCLNERENLKELLRSIERQDYPHNLVEIILIDSMSNDESYELMCEFAHSHNDFYSIQVHKNPQEFLSAGINEAIRVFTGECLIRLDAHCSIPTNFVSNNVQVLNETQKLVVGGRRASVAAGKSGWKYTLLAAYESFSSSIVASLSKFSVAHAVDHLYHVCIRREVFEKVGYFDERLKRAEDKEFFYRLHTAGIEVWFDPRIVSYQKVKSDFLSLMVQCYNNGLWIGVLERLNPPAVKFYHLMPLCFFGIFLLLLLIAFVWKMYKPLYFFLGNYLTFASALSIIAASEVRFKSWHLLSLPFLFTLMHILYATGSLWGMLKALFTSKIKHK